MTKQEKLSNYTTALNRFEEATEALNERKAQLIKAESELLADDALVGILESTGVNCYERLVKVENGNVVTRAIPRVPNIYELDGE